MDELSVQQHLLPPVLFLMMLTVGLELRLNQFRTLLQTPRVPVIGTIIHSLTFPMLAVVAVLGAKWAGLQTQEALVLGVLLIAACPSGGFSNVLALMAKVNLALSVVLTILSSALSFVTVPLLLGGFAWFVAELQGDVELPVRQILLQLGLLVLLPVIVGMAAVAKVTWFTPARVARLQNAFQALLYLTVFLLIAENWEVMRTGFFAALPWSAGLFVANIVCCFVLSRFAGLAIEDAITVSLEGSIRNLGVAFLIAANTLDRMDIAVLPTIYFLSVLVFSILFAKNWRRILKTG